MKFKEEDRVRITGLPFFHNKGKWFKNRGRIVKKNGENIAGKEIYLVRWTDVPPELITPFKRRLGICDYEKVDTDTVQSSFCVAYLEKFGETKLREMLKNGEITAKQYKEGMMKVME